MSLLRELPWAQAMIIATLSACSAETETLTLTGLTMGTGYSVRIVQPVDSPSLDPLAARIAEQLEALDAQFSTYREASEISRFNAH